jgi:hypothetical protein
MGILGGASLPHPMMQERAASVIQTNTATELLASAPDRLVVGENRLLDMETSMAFVGHL